MDEEKQKKKRLNLNRAYPGYGEFRNVVQRSFLTPQEANDNVEFQKDIGHFEPMNEGNMGSGVFIGLNECPRLNAIEKRCRAIGLYSYDFRHELLPICGIHQLCYLCVSYDG